jgi:hypothetical protein
VPGRSRFPSLRANLPVVESRDEQHSHFNHQHAVPVSGIDRCRIPVPQLI